MIYNSNKRIIYILIVPLNPSNNADEKINTNDFDKLI